MNKAKAILSKEEQTAFLARLRTCAMLAIKNSGCHPSVAADMIAPVIKGAKLYWATGDESSLNMMPYEFKKLVLQGLPNKGEAL